jgi:hypothetical protein
VTARMTDRHHAAFERWVPEVARQRISELRALPTLTADDHRLLDRLATYPVMRTEVWEKLPPSAKGAEGFIILWVFLAARFAADHRPPLPRRKEEIPRYLQKYPPTYTPENAAAFASMLLDAMKTTSYHAQECWTSQWPAHPHVTLTFENVVSIVEQIGTFYSALDEAHKKFLATISLPDIRKKNARNAREWVFTRLLAHHFQKRFGKPLDPIIAELSAVVFDQDAGVGSSTIRGRRRSAPGAAHSSKKSK